MLQVWGLYGNCLYIYYLQAEGIVLALMLYCHWRLLCVDFTAKVLIDVACCAIMDTKQP